MAGNGHGHPGPSQKDYNPNGMGIHRKVLVLAAGLIIALAAGAAPASGPALAAPAEQPPTPFPTPTPNDQGEIIYTVQEGDTAWRIAAIAGITLEELYALNGLQDTDFLQPGRQLVLGRVQPPQHTQDPEAVEEAPQATPTPERGTGEICALLFEDANGNARLDEVEVPLSGGQVSVANASGQVVGESETADQMNEEEDIVGVCFSDLEDGDYNVSGAVPEGYNPTTSMNAPVRLNPGESKFVEFGAQASAAALEDAQEAGGGRSTLLGVVGVALLFAAGGLGYYATRYGRNTPRSLR